MAWKTASKKEVAAPAPPLTTLSLHPPPWRRSWEGPVQDDAGIGSSLYQEKASFRRLLWGLWKGWKAVSQQMNLKVKAKGDQAVRDDGKGFPRPGAWSNECFPFRALSPSPFPFICLRKKYVLESRSQGRTFSNSDFPTTLVESYFLRSCYLENPENQDSSTVECKQERS